MKIVSMAVLGLGVALTSGAAQALPAAPAADAAPLVQNVMGGDGCGPYAFRTPRGFCRPVARPGYAPPRAYGPPPYDRPYWRGGYGGPGYGYR